MALWFRLLVLLFVIAVPSIRADVSATFHTAGEIPVTSDGCAASGSLSLTLDFAPLPGTNLTVVKNTGFAFISGEFSNVAHGQLVTLPFGGVNYRFVANYYGGTGNDFVLHWAQTRLVAWGHNSTGQLGDYSDAERLLPVSVFSSDVLSGKIILSGSVGYDHSLALCSDGSVVAWGSNNFQELGNGSSAYNCPAPAPVLATGALAGRKVVSVVAADSDSLALCSDGRIVTWGKSVGYIPALVNSTGALAGKSVVAIAAGSAHQLALCSDGTIAAWGLNYEGQLGNNSLTDSAVPVAVDLSGILAGKKVNVIAASGASVVSRK